MDLLKAQAPMQVAYVVIEEYRVYFSIYHSEFIMTLLNWRPM